MYFKYDEDISANLFFIELKEKHKDIVKNSSEDNWIICVPRNGTFSSEISVDNIFDHILIHRIEDKYCTLSNKPLEVKGEFIYQQNAANSPVEILFKESFYIDKTKRFTVWCIDQPLYAKYIICDSHNITVLETLHDCIDFLWAENLGHSLLEKIQKLCERFMTEEESFESERLQNQKELIGNLYSQCLQLSLNDPIIEKCEKDVVYLNKIKVAVETYMQHCLGKKLVYGLNTSLQQADSTFNKIIRNSKEITFQDLDIPSDLCELITSARSVLSKINNCVTVLDKSSCLKKTVDVIFNNTENVCVTSDILLQIFAFLIVKLNINNWMSNLAFLKEFKLSLSESSDCSNYFITTLEAAIEFIKSKKFSDICLILSGKDCLEASYVKLKSGIIETSELGETNLCHPLCSCDRCIKFCQCTYEIFNTKGQNLLTYSTLKCDVAAVENLLFAKYDINFTDHFGRTALHYAAAHGFQDVLFVLLSYNPNVNHPDNDKNTPLHLACDRGQENCVKALIFSCNQIEINYKNSLGETPLFLAVKWGYLEIVKLLLESGASVCVRNNSNQSLYNVATNSYLLKLIDQYGLNESYIFNNDIMETKKENNFVRHINFNCKEHGTRPKNVDQFKKINLLLKAIENNDFPLTCFYLGFTSSSKCVDKVEKKCHPLCNCRKCVNEQETENISNVSNHEKININMCNVHGYTPLHIAAKFGRMDVLRLLLDSGSLLNVRTYKTLYTPLHLAVIYQRVQIVRELLNCGNCEVDSQDVYGNTPLYYACLNNDVKIIEILLMNGADCLKYNCNGRTVIQEVEDRNQYRVFKLLKNSLKTSDINQNGTKDYLFL